MIERGLKTALLDESQPNAKVGRAKLGSQFQRPPISDNAHFGAGGMSYEVVEPLQSVAMRYHGEILVLDDGFVQVVALSHIDRGKDL